MRAIAAFAGMHRVVEVLFGCFVGIAVAWGLSKVWPLREPRDPSKVEGTASG